MHSASLRGTFLADDHRIPRTTRAAAAAVVSRSWFRKHRMMPPGDPTADGWLGSKTLMPSALVPFTMSLAIPPAVSAFVERVSAHREPVRRSAPGAANTLFPGLSVPKTPLKLTSPQSLQGTLTSFSSTAGGDGDVPGTASTSSLKPKKPQAGSSLVAVGGSKRSWRGTDTNNSQPDLLQSMDSTTGIHDVLSAGSTVSSAPSSAAPRPSSSRNVSVSFYPKFVLAVRKLQQDVIHLLVDPQPVHIPRAPVAVTV